MIYGLETIFNILFILAIIGFISIRQSKIYKKSNRII